MGSRTYKPLFFLEPHCYMGAEVMQCLYIICIGLILVKVSSAYQSINDYEDTGTCTGESKPGNSPFVPQHYSLHLRLEPHQKYFRGEVNITGTLNQDYQGDSIELHSVNLVVEKVRVNGKDVGDEFSVNDTVGTLSITLPKNIHNYINRNLTVGVIYEGYFNDTTGVIMQMYDKNDTDRWIIFTHLEPISARTVFPCIDLPRYKAKFDISIRNSFPGKRTILSNMPQIKSSDRSVVKFHTTPLMSTYLVSFVVCDYVPVTVGSTNRKFTTWVPREMKGKYESKYLAAMVPTLLNILEIYIGYPYSLPKLDMYVVMDKPGIGGMENWGLIMYQVDSAGQNKRATANNLARVVYTITHELAHHWYGNSVTVADWCHMWFQEAIPTFLHGSMPARHSYDLDEPNRVKWTARKEVMDSECFFYDDSVPLRDPDNPRVDEKTLFSLARYYKGANLLFMIESMVTPKVFQAALRLFYVKYNNAYATEYELWETVENENRVQQTFTSQVSLAEIADTWVTNRSHPIVVLKRHDNGTISLSQRVCIQKYVMDGEWYIPITYATSKRPNFNDPSTQGWVVPMGEELQPLDNVRLAYDEWIILNVMGTGFYRVQYDNFTWKLIIKQLKKDAATDIEKSVIPPLHRAMLVDDSFHTANNGEGLVQVFKLMEYLRNETSSYVWEAMVNNVGFQYGEFPKDVKDLFKKYMQFLLKDVFDKVCNTTQWHVAYFDRLESINEKSIRDAIFDLSTMMKLPTAEKFSVKTALDVIQKRMAEKIIPREIVDKLWCEAVSAGNERIFAHVQTAYNNEKDNKKKIQLFEQMSCSKKHTKNLLVLMKNDSDGNKEDLLKNVKDFVANHWPEECEEILSFIEHNKMDLVDEKYYSQQTLIKAVQNTKKQVAAIWPGIKIYMMSCSAWKILENSVDHPEFKKTICIYMSRRVSIQRLVVAEQALLADTGVITNFLYLHGLNFSESRLASEFQGYLKTPLDQCKPMTLKIFGSIDDAIEDYHDWNETFGEKPIEWLRKQRAKWEV